jgi:methylated-DNA-protein-cysteine methyltransferase related protein
MDEKIYKIVSSVPFGKVVTYSDIASQIGNRRLARVVGNVLHKNPMPEIIPCHRVVNYVGFVSNAYAFGGSSQQSMKLKIEGVGFTSKNKVDLGKFRYYFHH